MRVVALLFTLSACSSSSGTNPQVTLVGSGAGATTNAVLTSVYESDRPRIITGLAFNPTHPEELWMVAYRNNDTITVTNAGTPNAEVQVRRDPAAVHFMHRPTGIAFAPDESWGTCGENDNSQNGNPGFMGPAVFSSDPAIFATQNPDTGLGSHYDMLHASPFCMGIAHEVDHAYWIFDGENSAIVRYDFKTFHPPGEDDHSDGEIRFYAIGQVKRVPNIPSQLAWDPVNQHVYVSDTGNARVVKLDPSTATQGKSRSTLEPSVPVEMDGATLSDFVPAGTVAVPTGLAIADKIVYVADNSTSRVYAFGLDGKTIHYFDTGLPAGSIASLTVGPDGKLYLADMLGSRAFRVDVQ